MTLAKYGHGKCRLCCSCDYTWSTSQQTERSHHFASFKSSVILVPQFFLEPNGNTSANRLIDFRVIETRQESQAQVKII